MRILRRIDELADDIGEMRRELKKLKSRNKVQFDVKEADMVDVSVVRDDSVVSAEVQESTGTTYMSQNLIMVLKLILFTIGRSIGGVLW